MEGIDDIKWPLKFKTLARCSKSMAKTSLLELPHHTVETPIFMPVGTQGTMKGITSHHMEEINCQIILANTYHLGMRPGSDILLKAGKLHKFMNWNRAMLTDSGGFQMVSLVKLCEVTEKGVQFRSPYDDSDIMLTPEKSIEIQNAIGADIMMQLDDVVDVSIHGPRVEEAMHRSLRWLDRCIKANKSHDQNLFPIIQGGLDLQLRTQSIQDILKRKTPGIAIGGLSGGEAKEEFWKVVYHCTKLLPRDKPIYVMGVGYALDLVVCSALGADMFDCVFPTRTARFGTALVRSGQLHLKSKQFKDDFRPIDHECRCNTCKRYTRAYLHSTVGKQSVGCHLITVHNLTYQMDLMSGIRESLKSDTFELFVRKFMKDLFSDEAYPQWAIDAFNAVNITLEDEKEVCS